MPEPSAADYAAPQPHDPITQLFNDVYCVHGSISLSADRSDLRINRNMVVLRDGVALTVIHPVRLSAEGERELDGLGAVKQVVRLGNAHGIDDRYYVDRYGAEFWCQDGSTKYPEPERTHILAEGSALPVPDAELFVFCEPNIPESAIVLSRHGGLLITCDSLQHWVAWSHCTPQARELLEKGGFALTTLVGPAWRKRVTPEGGSLKGDFARLLELDFKHHIGAHGALSRDNAHALVEAAVAKAYPD